MILLSQNVHSKLYIIIVKRGFITLKYHQLNYTTINKRFDLHSTLATWTVQIRDEKKNSITLQWAPIGDINDV